MKNILYTLIGICLVTFFSACQSSDEILITDIIDTEQPIMNQDFVNDIGSDLIMEQTIADLTIRKSVNEDVIQLAKEVQYDYVMAEKDLQKIVEQQNLEYPDSMSENNKIRLKMLQKDYSLGNSLDTLYLNYMQARHVATLNKFEAFINAPKIYEITFTSEIQNIEQAGLMIENNPKKISKEEKEAYITTYKKLKSWIESKSDVLEEHLDDIKEIKKKNNNEEDEKAVLKF